MSSAVASRYAFFLLLRLTNNTTTHITTNTSSAMEVYSMVLFIVIDFEGHPLAKRS
jgi:hypothetical protein